jgi:chloramphenicol O-acetyltransferase type A
MTSPFFGIVTEVDCTNAYTKAKENNQSFFASYLHKSMIAINSVEEMKYRIVGDKVVVFEQVNAGATIGRDDGTFGFIFVNFFNDFEQFNLELQNEIEAVKNSTGLRLNNDNVKKDLLGILQFHGILLLDYYILQISIKQNRFQKSHLVNS